MKTCSRSSCVPLWIFMIQVLEAQQVRVSPEVTGYLGRDVALPCQLTQAPTHTDVAQVQWELKAPDGDKILIVFTPGFGVKVSDTFLKDRVEMSEQSLIIRDVEMRDAGSYTCSIATFPFGSLEGTTKLLVQEQVPAQMCMLPRMIAAGVFVLIVVIMFSTTYFITIRIRCSRSGDERLKETK